MKASDIFKCKQCGECCKGYGGTFVTPGDIKAIAAYIDADPETFVAKYCEISGDKPVIAVADNGYCIFWDTLCTIHPVKPHMCRKWPFIPSVLVDINNWQIMAGFCPGIRIDVPDSIIKGIIRNKLQK